MPVRLGQKLLPELHVDRVAGLQRFAFFNSQERVRLTQPKKRMRFLPADRREISGLEFPAKIMRAIAFIVEIDR